MDSAVIFDVKSGFGIGSGKIKLVEGKWPSTALLRLHLAGLEGFSISSGKKSMNRSDLNVRMLDVKGNPVAGRYLLKSLGPNKSERIKGYFEVTVPASLLTPETKELQISWVDFYR